MFHQLETEMEMQVDRVEMREEQVEAVAEEEEVEKLKLTKFLC